MSKPKIIEEIDNLNKELISPLYKALVTTNQEINPLDVSSNRNINVNIQGLTNFTPNDPLIGISVGDVHTKIITKDSNGNTKTYFDIPFSLRSLPNGTKDEIISNKLYKRVEKLILDGTLDWVHYSNKVGYKSIKLIIDGYVNNSNVCLKYNNTILPQSSTVSDGTDIIVDSDNLIYLNISNSDSGWGDGYTPTVDEIKAYFNGWTMFESTGMVYTGLYNGTGTKSWAKVYSGVGTQSTTNFTVPVVSGSSVFSTCPTALNDQGYTPYRLYYQLATPSITNIIKPNLVAYPNGTLNIESDSNVFVRPTVTYTVADSEKANIDEMMESVNSNTSHLAQKTTILTANGTANAITLNVTLEDKGKYSFKAVADSTGAVTINEIPLKKTDGTAVSNLKVNKVYDFYYDATANSVFILAKAEGDATVGDVLAGKVFTNGDESGLVGTMPNNGALSHTPTASGNWFSAGYYSSIHINGDSDLTPANIISGKNIFGVTGTAKSITPVASDELAINLLPNEYIQNNNYIYTAYDALIIGTIQFSGTYRISIDMARSVGVSGDILVYKNGSPVGSVMTESSTTYVTHTQDYTFAEGDYVQLYLRTYGSTTIKLKNLKVSIANVLFVK